MPMLTFIVALSFFLLPLGLSAQTQPQLDYVMQLKVTCGPAYTDQGHTIIPITGGTFEGPLLRGIVLPGGADTQTVDPDNQRTDLDAAYAILTDDSVTIQVRNRGIIHHDYFRASPVFTAPADSRYAWLNNAIFVCLPQACNGYISLKVWKVR